MEIQIRVRGTENQIKNLLAKVPSGIRELFASQKSHKFNRTNEKI